MSLSTELEVSYSAIDYRILCTVLAAVFFTLSGAMLLVGEPQGAVFFALAFVLSVVWAMSAFRSSWHPLRYAQIPTSQ